MVQRLDGKQPAEVWRAFNDHWARIFGYPDMVVTDPGREFLSDFMQTALSYGIVVHQTAARAVWEQGKTDRHGAHWKELLKKARAEVVVTTEDELNQLMREVEQAKNRYANRSGFSPIQRQIGQWPRLPTELLGDDHINPALLGGVLVDDMERLLEMRRVAQKVFCEVNAKETIKRAIRGRHRGWHDYKAGELVYVYRVPKARKRKSGDYEETNTGSNRATWVGPGVVVVPDGANLWVSMMGQLWRVAREQCRPATSGEKEGTEAVLQDCQELIEECKKGSKRAGYHDISKEPWPPEEEDREGHKEVEELSRGVKRPLEGTDVLEDSEDCDYVPTSPPQEEGDSEVAVHPAPSLQPTISSTSTEEESMLEPEAEASRMVTPEVVAPPIDWQSSEVQEQALEAQQHADRLDGHGPMRSRVRRRAGNPYQVEIQIYFTGGEEDLTDEEDSEDERLEHLQKLQTLHSDKDYWEVDQRTEAS